MKDFCIVETKSDDLLLKLGAALGKENINIEGLSLTSDNEKAIVHLAVEDEIAAQKTLAEAGLNILKISEVYVFDKDEKQATGKPGSFGEICRKLKDNHVSITFGYPAENNRFLFGVDDIEKAKEVLG